MPVYDFKCPNGHLFDRFLPLARYDEPQDCACGERATKMVSAPFVRADIPAYVSPVTEKLISSRVQRREDLKASGCIEWEKGMREDGERNLRVRELMEESSLDQTIEKAIIDLPARKREALEGEMAGGLDVKIERSTPNA